MASKIVLMEEIRPTSWYGKIHDLQGFIHVGWCRISSINSMLATGPFHPVLLTLRARCDMWSLLYLLHLAPSLPGAENVPSRFLLKPPASKCLKIYQIFYRTWVNLSSEFTHFWISKVFPGAKIEDKRFVSQLKTSILPKKKMWKVLYNLWHRAWGGAIWKPSLRFDVHSSLNFSVYFGDTSGRCPDPSSTT